MRDERRLAEEVERLRAGIRAFREAAGRHEGGHVFGTQVGACELCERSYVEAEAALYALVLPLRPLDLATAPTELAERGAAAREVIARAAEARKVSPDLLRSEINSDPTPEAGT